jgi:ribose transport system permease protein
MRNPRVIQQYGAQVLVFAAAWLGFAATTPGLRGSAGVYSVLLGFPLVGLVALGAAGTIIAGEMDLSVGASAAVAGAVAVRCAGQGLVVAIIAPVAVLGAFGAIQGIVIAWLRINSLLITIGTSIFLGGVLFEVCGGNPISVSNVAITFPLLDRWWIFSPDIIIAIVVFGAAAVFYSRVRYGREIYATGGARAEAIAAGVRTRRAIIVTFTVSAALAALAGSIAALKVGGADPTADTTLLLEAMSAVFVGGISLYGGRGTVGNVVLGVGILSVIAAGLSDRGAQEYAVQLVTGLILLAVVTFEVLVRKLATRTAWPAADLLSGRKTRASSL